MALKNHLVIFLILVPLLIDCKPYKPNTDSSYKEDYSEYAINILRNYSQIDYKKQDENFDSKLLDLIDDKKTVNSRQKSSERVKSFLTQDDKLLMEEQIREKLIERLKKVYVKTSRSR